jgi:putative component of toxin-antitoxin plasmid stabilization module
MERSPRRRERGGTGISMLGGGNRSSQKADIAAAKALAATVEK